MITMATKNNQYSWLINVVNNLKKNTIIENNPISIFVVTNVQPNAWVYPTLKFHKSLTVTTSLLFNFSKADIITTISHELGHLIDFKLNPQLVVTGNRKFKKLNQMKIVLHSLHQLYFGIWDGTDNFFRTIIVMIMLDLVYLFFNNSLMNICLSYTVLGLGEFVAVFVLFYVGLDLNYNAFERHLENNADLKGAYLTNNHAMINELLNMKVVTNVIENNLNHGQYKNIENSLPQKLGFVNHPTTKERIEYIKKNY